MSTRDLQPRIVVLVHGLYLSGNWMRVLASRLRQFGLQPVPFNYPSRRAAPEACADRLHEWLSARRAERVDFVAHSLGGLVLRYLFFRHPEQRPGRVVTLGTPHQPCYAARWIRDHDLGFAIGSAAMPVLLGRVPAWDARVELGSIAGNLAVGLGRLFPGLPKPNDGTVAVSETRADGMADHLVLHTTHTGLIFSESVAVAAAEFLERGRFGGARRVAPAEPNP